MSETNVTDRLKETSANCIKSYDAWMKDMKDPSIREELQAHIHELRKVASRLEIDIAMSERDQMRSKRIPIPPHRSAKQNTKKNDVKDSAPANNDSDNDQASADVKKSLRRTRKPKSAAGGEE